MRLALTVAFVCSRVSLARVYVVLRVPKTASGVGLSPELYLSVLSVSSLLGHLRP